MLVLDDAGVGGLGIGVVHHGVALIVVGVQHLGLKADAAVLQSPQTVAKVGIHRAGVHHLVGQRIQRLTVSQIVHIQAHLGALQHVFHHGGVAAVGDALIQGVEIVVVVGKTHRQALDDKGRQLSAGAAPLLAGVALDELFVDVGAHQAASRSSGFGSTAFCGSVMPASAFCCSILAFASAGVTTPHILLKVFMLKGRL